MPTKKLSLILILSLNYSLSSAAIIKSEELLREFKNLNLPHVLDDLITQYLATEYVLEKEFPLKSSTNAMLSLSNNAIIYSNLDTIELEVGQYLEYSIKILDLNTGVSKPLITNLPIVKQIIKIRDLLIYGTTNGEIKAYNLSNGDSFNIGKEPHEINSLIALSDDYVATGTSGLKIWDIKNIKLEKEVIPYGKVGALTLLSDNKLIASLHDYSKIFDTKNWRLKKELAPANVILELEQNLLVLDYPQYCMTMADLRQDMDAPKFKRIDKESRYYITGLVKLSNQTFASSSGNQIKIWHKDQEKPLQVIDCPKHIHDLIALPNGSLIASFDDRLALYSVIGIKTTLS